MIKFIKVTLNNAEQRLSHYIAKRRYLNARKNNVTNAKVGGQSNEQTDLDGIAAEIAFCKVMNVYPDLSIEDPSKLPDWDCVLPDGTTVDVKSTRYKNGHLVAVRKKATSSTEVYALVTGAFPNYTIVGTATKDELIREENLKDLGCGTNYALEQDQLRSIHREGMANEV